jgi:RNA polymerase sigma-70 factor (ECF subfamily)
VVEYLLVVRCQAGDDGAFADLVLRYDARLRFYVQKILGRGDDVDDLMQDVWLSVFRKIAKLRSPLNFRPWVYRIARDTAFQELRRRRRHPRVTGEPNAVEAPETPDSPGEEVAIIYVCLDKLRPEHRDVLLLRFLEDMSYEEIADATGAPVGTVRSRIHYAKRALLREMERTGHG